MAVAGISKWQFYKRSLLSNKEAVSNVIVDNDNFLISESWVGIL